MFVRVKSDVSLPDFYICHSSEIGNRIGGERAAWLVVPKRNAEPRKDSNMRQFISSAEELETHKGNWQKMFEGS